MDIVADLLAKAARRGGTVVFPEGAEERVLRAAKRLGEEAGASAVLIGQRDEIDAAAADLGLTLRTFSIRDPDDDESVAEFARRCAHTRERMSEVMAARLMHKPLYFGAMMVGAGEADTMVAGISTPSRRVIEAGLMTVGLAEGFTQPSSFFLMIVPNFLGQGPRPFIFADCGAAIDPSPEELAEIAIASAESGAQLLPDPPRVAMLSFSTDGSATHPRVDKIRKALAIARARAPELLIDGELQVDAALTPAVAARKLDRESPVAGRANVLIFPDLDSGNIGYKLTQYMAGAKAIGPILQGFARPICDLSRGATVDDIVTAAAIGLIRA